MIFMCFCLIKVNRKSISKTPSTGGHVAQIHLGGVPLELPRFQEIRRKHNLLAGRIC